ncbi:hypothetical protein K466DRAFT_659417 [Polyporus arcularius HHB13444]|uniref:Uncharacterized protein n=1 Tax=Polyporus arcularius HHB13444 TaxID=1314778 RepID=A0A5C3PSS8_9APHY|nr:hypothetical protein K466DRAFT_659417 [Polyporus arcularius HHB13444]
MPIVLQYHSPDELFPEACLDPKLASQTPQEVFRDFFDNVTQTPDQSHIDLLRAKLTRVPGGEKWTQGKVKQWFRRQRTRQPKLAEYQQRREQMAGELMSQLQDVLPRRPRPYERSPKSFKELTQWLEAPNASSLTFLRDVAAGTYTRIGLIPRDVAPLISHQAGNIPPS